MRNVFGCWLGTATGCLVFLFGADRVFVMRQPPATLVDAPGYRELAQQNCDLRWENYKARGRVIDLEVEAARVRCEVENERARAEFAEQQAATFRTLADAARREGMDRPRLGDDPADRIPPQNVPLP